MSPQTAIVHLRSILTSLSVATVLVAGAAPAHAAGWQDAADRLIGRKNMSVSVAEEGRTLYGHRAGWKRIPASNQKMLMSMALYGRVSDGHRFTTAAQIRTKSLPAPGRTYEGYMWLVGSGDPTLAGNGTYGTKMPFPPTHLRDLAEAIRDMGIRRIEGRVMGRVDYFEHDWWAYGWKSDFPGDEVALPTALAVDGNLDRNEDPVYRPEKAAAAWLTRRLERIGVTVTGKPGSGLPSNEFATIAQIESAPINRIVSYTNRVSHNFFAEMLGKSLGAMRSGPLGTIEKGAAAIEWWAGRHEVDVDAYDSSGLSFANRVSPKGMVKLLGIAEDRPWGLVFKRGLAGGGQGTMQDRLRRGVRIKVKTGTLDGVSTLSGYVLLEKTQTWAEFSIMSQGLSKWKAIEVEDKLVRLIAERAS